MFRGEGSQRTLLLQESARRSSSCRMNNLADLWGSVHFRELAMQKRCFQRA